MKSYNNRFGRNLVACVAATLGACFSLPARANAYTYQIDNNNVAGSIGFQNSLYGESEDSWAANTFTATASGNKLTSISWLLNNGLNGLPNLTNSTAYYALYSGTPTGGLTLVSSASANISSSIAEAEANGTAWITQSMPAVTVTPGEQFTAAVMMLNVPSNAYPLSEDNSGTSTSAGGSSYYDISSPFGTVNAYNMASPNFPTLNGVNYPGQTSTNAFLGLDFIRVNAVYTPEPSSMILAGIAGAIAIGYGVRRRRSV